MFARPFMIHELFVIVFSRSLAALSSDYYNCWKWLQNILTEWNLQGGEFVAGVSLQGEWEGRTVTGWSQGVWEPIPWTDHGSQDWTISGPRETQCTSRLRLCQHSGNHRPLIYLYQWVGLLKLNSPSFKFRISLFSTCMQDNMRIIIMTLNSKL